MTKLNILISDGRKVVREGLRALLQHHPAFRVVGEADSAATAVKLVAPMDVQIVIALLPQANSPLAEAQSAVRMVRDLSSQHPQIKVIALTYGLSLSEVRQLVAAGAAGCLTRECAFEELISAIHTVTEDKVYLSPLLTEQMVRRYVEPGQIFTGRASRSTLLAPRETEVLRRIAIGQSTKEIAFALQVGSKTIETHRRRIMQKLQRHSVAELTQYAMIQGLIPLPERVEA